MTERTPPPRSGQRSAASPLVYSQRLGRPIRGDGIDTLGVSTQTLFEAAMRSGDGRLAVQLLEYFWDEMHRIGEALFTWLEDIVAWRLERSGDAAATAAGALLEGLRRFDPSSGDRLRAAAACRSGDTAVALEAGELMRVRYASLHDALVVWIQELLRAVSDDHGEDAVREVVERAYERLWRPRYDTWHLMSAEERLQLSVEGMRGHLSGRRRRGDVGIEEEPDRYVMVLDPCGSCGVLRRGDPESGRPPYEPAGNRTPRPWTWGRVGVGWYAVHSPIVMEFIWMRSGRPPMRPLEGCDTEGPCRWYVYKDPKAARAEHYARMGFEPPAG